MDPSNWGIEKHLVHCRLALGADPRHGPCSDRWLDRWLELWWLENTVAAENGWWECGGLRSRSAGWASPASAAHPNGLMVVH